MSDPVPSPEPDAPASAYELLSRPVLELTDAEVETVLADLRRKRHLFLTKGEADNPKKASKASAAKLSADDKKANTLSLLAQLNLKLPGQSS